MPFSCTHHQQVIVHTGAPETLKMLELHHEVEKHELIICRVTTIVLSCEAG